MNLIQPEHPFFRPPYRRYITVAVAASWAAMEWGLANDPFWGLLATGMAGLAFYELIYRYKLPPQEAAKGAEPDVKS